MVLQASDGAIREINSGVNRADFSLTGAGSGDVTTRSPPSAASDTRPHWLDLAPDIDVDQMALAYEVDEESFVFDGDGTMPAGDDIYIAVADPAKRPAKRPKGNPYEYEDSVLKPVRAAPTGEKVDVTTISPYEYEETVLKASGSTARKVEQASASYEYEISAPYGPRSTFGPADTSGQGAASEYEISRRMQKQLP